MTRELTTRRVAVEVSNADLFLLSAIAVLPMRAGADPCANGYELVEMQGPWTVCQPITDPQSCEPISQGVCYVQMDFIIGSKLAACEHTITVLNERCVANKAVWRRQMEVQLACTPTPPANPATCEKARQALHLAEERAHEVHEKTKRRLTQPSGSGGRGFSICF